MDEQITLDEWKNAYLFFNNKAAADPFSLNYTIIKKLLSTWVDIIIYFFNITLDLGIILVTWKTLNIFMILKPNKYNYNIRNTRPIALLDSFRKVVTKIMENRLSALLFKYNILRGLNYCDLKGELTEPPIHLVNSVIEDVLQHNKELWILTQDMVKAYDSVCLDSLKLSLSHIDLSKNFITWICAIFTHRQIAIITSFRLSPQFTGLDEVDQGDSISPLL